MNDYFSLQRRFNTAEHSCDVSFLKGHMKQKNVSIFLSQRHLVFFVSQNYKSVAKLSK